MTALPARAVADAALRATTGMRAGTATTIAIITTGTTRLRVRTGVSG